MCYGIFVLISRYKGFQIGGPLTLHNIFIEPFIGGHQFAYNMGSWFVAPLFFIEVFNEALRQFFKKFNLCVPELFFLVTYTALGISGNHLAFIWNGNYNRNWIALLRFLHFLPFFELGTFYKLHLEKYDQRLSNYIYFGVLFGCQFLIFYILRRNPAYTDAWLNNLKDGAVFPIIVGSTTIFFWLRIATIIEPLSRKWCWSNLIADNAFSIMMNQFLGFMAVKTVFAALARFTRVYPILGWIPFEWKKYKSEIFWYYTPFKLRYFYIFYLLAGLIVPIIIQMIINRIKEFICTLSLTKS